MSTSGAHNYEILKYQWRIQGRSAPPPPLLIWRSGSATEYYKKFLTIQGSTYLSVDIKKWKKYMKISPLKNGLQLQILS